MEYINPDMVDTTLGLKVEKLFTSLHGIIFQDTNISINIAVKTLKSRIIIKTRFCYQQPHKISKQDTS